MITQFAFHDRVSSTPPQCEMFDLHNKLEKGETITTEQKKKIINSFYGIGGQQYGTVYKQGGWQANFRPFLKRILVKLKDYGWKEYRSFNKTMLREVLGSHNCIEMVEIPTK